MLNLTWKLFSETGNIEAYLLLKQLEDENKQTSHEKATPISNEKIVHADLKI